VRVASALTIGASEPEPDVAVIDRDAPRPYHPGRGALVIEVAVSSLARDLGRKAALYAPVVSEYWVVDLDGRRVVAHRASSGERYDDIVEVTAGDGLDAVALRLPTLVVEDLLRAAR
jgi:Uma2 family endonuclease